MFLSLLFFRYTICIAKFGNRQNTSLSITPCFFFECRRKTGKPEQGQTKKKPSANFVIEWLQTNPRLRT
jgi:hypothetical protein